MLSTAKIKTFKEVAVLCDKWKSNGLKIAFTNGCFDILHFGHVDYLEKAKGLADKLVVGLNTDASIKRIKGESRPIVDQVSRSRVMAALAFVDAVVLFDEDTPLKLIQSVKPDVLVKGNDYNICNIVGADFVMSYGGKVDTVPLIEGYSTSKIIEKIQNLK